MNNVIWLASYPKSGNTWFRSFITAVLNGGEIDINKMDTDGIFSGKDVLESQLDLSSDDLLEHEIHQYQRIAYQSMSRFHFERQSVKYSENQSNVGQGTRNRRSVLFVKVHDAYTYAPWDGLPIIPTEVSQLVIYIIRNPLDVTLSLSNHSNSDHDSTIGEFMCSPSAAFIKKNRSAIQFRQLMGSWQMHARSWIEQSNIPVHVIRYEDMLSRPVETFTSALDRIGIDAAEDVVLKAIQATSFEKLSAQEEEKGFKEKPIPAKRFFFKGTSGRWKSELSPSQITRVCEANSKYMKRFQYWPS